jgi:hypothetical protein
MEAARGIEYETLHLAIGLSLLVGNPSNIGAQNWSWIINAQSSTPAPTGCESNSSTLSASHQAASATGADSVIIAIAHLGDSERTRELNRRRLHNVRVFLTDFWKRAPYTVITAEAERVRGYGRVELYVGGRLFDVIAVGTNSDLLVSLTCEPDSIRPKWADRNLYPYLDKKPRPSSKTPSQAEQP